MELKDIILLLHPVLAITIVFPIIGIVINKAWQTRQRRLQTAEGGKSKIPPIVGQEHVQLGRWLTGSVVGIALLGMTRPIFTEIFKKQVWTTAPFQVLFIVLIYGGTIAALVFLYKARQKLWKGVFATLSGMGLILLGFQNGVFRRDDEWFVSHYYYGIGAALLMIFSLAIVQDIYQDRSLRWRKVHIILNCLALLLFLGQGMTGARDLLEIPLSWQEPHVYKCDYKKRVCPDSPKPQSGIDSLITSSITSIN